MNKTKQITLDGEAADRITVLNLQECRGYLKKEIKNFKKGEYLHPEDVAGNIKLIEAMDLVIKYYGG
jgi:hypothetical protein